MKRVDNHTAKARPVIKRQTERREREREETKGTDGRVERLVGVKGKGKEEQKGKVENEEEREDEERKRRIARKAKGVKISMFVDCYSYHNV